MNHDLRQSPQYADFLSKTGWQIIKLPNQTLAYKRSLGPFRNIIKIQRFSWPINLTKLDQLAQQHKSLFIKLEPAITIQLGNTKHLKTEKDLIHHGFHQDKWPLIPTKTRTIELTQTTNAIISKFSENCKRNIRRANKEQIKIEINTHNWQNFYTNWQKAAKQKKLIIPSFKNFLSMIESFGKNIHIINCSHHQHGWLAGLVMLNTAKTAYYYFATANKLGKQLRAPYLATSTAITVAKEIGCTVFDFDGIADPRYKATNNRDWQGFSEFKSKFGGQEVIYVGSFTKYYGAGKIIGLLNHIFGYV